MIPGCNRDMKPFLRLIVLSLGLGLFIISCSKTYTKEEIDKLFEPITSRYGIKIVYEIGQDFGPILIGGHHTHFNIAKPIDPPVLARYPHLLKKAFEKYPVSVIKEYLNAIYFAKELECNGTRYGGTYDPFRRIIYLVNNGKKTDDLSIGTFHHEFSSILLKRHTVLLNPWLEQNPKGFKYSKETISNNKDIYGVSIDGTAADYDLGFLDAYSRKSFEDDFNEYSRIIFTQPRKFKRIMNQYHRVRAKFEIWQDFYHKIDPIFTEEYLLGKS
jgi:hypothetical protein